MFWLCVGYPNSSALSIFLRSRSSLNSTVYSLRSTSYCFRYSLAVMLFFRTWIIFPMSPGFSMLRIALPDEFLRSMTY